MFNNEHKKRIIDTTEKVLHDTIEGYRRNAYAEYFPDYHFSKGILCGKWWDDFWAGYKEEPTIIPSFISDWLPRVCAKTAYLQEQLCIHKKVKEKRYINNLKYFKFVEVEEAVLVTKDNFSIISVDDINSEYFKQILGGNAI